MPLPKRDDKDRRADEVETVERGLQGLTHEIFRKRAPYEDAGPRDSFWLRWLKFVSIVFVLTLVGGFGFVYARGKFLIGAVVGLMLGITYVVRCIAKNIDP